jgi:RNA polymerase sigma factor (sigma-70 family)
MRIYAPQELIDGCKNNDRIVQREVYERYKDAMYTICYRILNNQELALDALQEGFVQFYKSINSFREESTLGSWMKTIMVRSAYKLIEQNKIVFLDEEHEEHSIIWPSTISNIDLERAINTLPNGAKITFLLAEVEGYSHKEIAEMLNISIGTSKSQLHAAKRKLQQVLSA